MSTKTADPEARASALRRIEAEKPRIEFGGAWDYSPAPESTDIVKLKKRYGLFIGGKFVKPRSAEWFPSHVTKGMQVVVLQD